MKAIRPDKRQVLSTREAMAEVKGGLKPAIEGLKITVPLGGELFQIEWSGSLGGEICTMPTAEMYGATILALGEMEENRLTRTIRKDLLGGYMITNSYMMPGEEPNESRVCHGHERYRDGIDAYPYSNNEGVQAMFGVKDPRKFDDAVRKVTGCPLRMYARRYGPVMLGKKHMERRDKIKVYSDLGVEARARGVRLTKL
ncbi:hypothetical protein ACFL0V_01355 [Nanoarchaeota archaeon]